MSYHIKKNREGFPFGITTITKENEKKLNTGIAFSILRLKEGETHSFQSPMEAALLLMDGKIEVLGKKMERNSLFDDPPSAVHVCRETQFQVKAITNAEIAIFETENEKTFPQTLYMPLDTENEHRGKGLVGDASLRYVRTIFDGTNSHPDAKLVLGEVVNFPGKWSSYPPHHHPQPEIYHYRFTDPRGYGHAELGDEVFKVRPFDTIKILDELDHAQCSAPGYGMYYIWTIRHLPDNKYIVPEFTEEHRWTMEPEAKFWDPKS